MCMKNLNATILTCVDASAKREDQGGLTYSDVFDFVVATKQTQDGYVLIDSFDVIINMLAVFNEHPSNDERIKVIECGDEYDCKICISYEGCELIDIGVFSFKADDALNKSFTNQTFFDSTRKVRVNDLELPKGIKKFDLVLLIKNKKAAANEKWVLQTIKRLQVFDKVN